MSALLVVIAVLGALAALGLVGAAYVIFFRVLRADVGLPRTTRAAATRDIKADPALRRESRFALLMLVVPLLLLLVGLVMGLYAQHR